MQKSKIEISILSLLFVVLFWFLLGLKLKIEEKLYVDFIFPIKKIIEKNSNLNMDIAAFEAFRHQMLDSINMVFLLFLGIWIYIIYSISFSKNQKTAIYFFLFITSALFFILPRII